MVEHVLKELNIEFERMLDSFAHNFAQVQIFYANMKNDVATKHAYFIS